MADYCRIDRVVSVRVNLGYTWREIDFNQARALLTLEGDTVVFMDTETLMVNRQGEQLLIRIKNPQTHALLNEPSRFTVDAAKFFNDLREAIR